ncbi:Glycosyltransferase family 39 protein [Mycena venus]|uniref:Glycosyltransferase family 39 protein n=1 Tax=Mycena venus TaxID=2733690 RepID=A0A8H7CMQ1_9AGAR|nr:Glycosyltransferase family 39 protein [Mycena venus]
MLFLLTCILSSLFLPAACQFDDSDLDGFGNNFMLPAQEILSGNEMLLNSQEIKYYDTVTIRHKETKVFLHSHIEWYPLRYEDGRISSRGQQVTGYSHNDSTNNNWQIIPSKALTEHSHQGQYVRHGDLIQLLHINTQSYLLTHDVASPLMPTNQEFTTWPKVNDDRYRETLFYINIKDGHEGEVVKSNAGHFWLVHGLTNVSMWTHAEQLPDWAFNQQEINGIKNAIEKTATWFIQDVIASETHGQTTAE